MYPIFYLLKGDYKGLGSNCVQEFYPPTQKKSRIGPISGSYSRTLDIHSLRFRGLGFRVPPYCSKTIPVMRGICTAVIVGGQYPKA